MYLIGLTGGIASGKSAVASRLAERGAVVVDADVIAREIVEPGTPALDQIARQFGPAVLTAHGSLDRPALGAIIFSDPDKRVALNAITHPAVWRLSRQRFAEAAAADPHAIVVYDVPLLAEGSRRDEFDLIAVVSASEDTRVDRLVRLRGMTRDEATARISSQATDAERLAIADVVIDSDGELADTLRQADELWDRALTDERAGANKP